MDVTISLRKRQMIHDLPGCNVTWTERHGRLEALAVADVSLRHGGDEFKIIRAGKAALATQRVPYQGRLDKDRTESRIFHLTNHRSVLMSRPCIGDVDCIDSRVHESLSSALSTTGSTERHPVSTLRLYLFEKSHSSPRTNKSQSSQPAPQASSIVCLVLA